MVDSHSAVMPSYQLWVPGFTAHSVGTYGLRLRSEGVLSLGSPGDHAFDACILPISSLRPHSVVAYSPSGIFYRVLVEVLRPFIVYVVAVLDFRIALWIVSELLKLVGVAHRILLRLLLGSKLIIGVGASWILGKFRINTAFGSIKDSRRLSMELSHLLQVLCLLVGLLHERGWILNRHGAAGSFFQIVKRSMIDLVPVSWVTIRAQRRFTHTLVLLVEFLVGFTHL